MNTFCEGIRRYLIHSTVSTTRAAPPRPAPRHRTDGVTSPEAGSAQFPGASAVRVQLRRIK